MSEIERIAAKVIENHYVEDFEAQNIVRTVLEAVRVPTANMIFHGHRAIGNDLRFVSPQDIYQAMIDELLK